MAPEEDGRALYHGRLRRPGADIRTLLVAIVSQFPERPSHGDDIIDDVGQSTTRK